MNLFDAITDPRETGQAAAERCEATAVARGWDAAAAGEYILALLRERGPTAGETLVSEAAKVFTPHDQRAFGAVFARLSRKKLIEVCGHARRAKGHGCGGGYIWRLPTTPTGNSEAQDANLVETAGA